MNVPTTITTRQRTALARTTRSGTDSASDPLTGAARVLAVLRYVAEHPEGCRLVDMATDLDGPKSSVHRALGALSAEGFVRQADDRSYHLGYGFLQLAFRYHEASAPYLAVAPVLQQLASTIGETTHYGVLVGPDIVYQAKVAAAGAGFQMSSVVGGSNPAYRTGVGKALLMHTLTTRADVEAFVRATGPLERRTPHTLVSVDDLHEGLQQGRRVGYALDLEENDLGVGCLAVPLFLDSPVTPTGAISLSAVTSRTSVADLVSRVDEIRSIITAGLGEVLRLGLGDS